MTDRLRSLLLELRECRSAINAVIEQKPMMAAMRAGSTTLGNRLAELKAVIKAHSDETSEQAPIAKLTVWENLNGTCVSAELYAPGLPPGTHDVYCEPMSVAPALNGSEGA